MKSLIFISCLLNPLWLVCDPGVTIEMKVVAPNYPTGPEKGKIYRIRK